MVDGIGRREAGRERGHRSLGRRGEPLLSGLATLLPVVALVGAGRGTGGGVDLAEASLFLRGIERPAAIVVGQPVIGR
jgi:hypothetical protein